jgi:multiphosphoryl transfer protein
MMKFKSPLRGWCASLDEVPDAVFAQRMLGDGIAIDPTSDTLHAPCAGEVISIAAGKHAIAIRSQAGVEILMHVGIDTVNLAGRGFEPLVEVGRTVQMGEALLRFDLEALAGHAKSLITPLVITNGEDFEIIRCGLNRLVQVGDELMEVRARPRASSSTLGSSATEVRERFTIELEHGLHARPAAMVANCAKHLAVDIRIEAHGRSANAASAVSIMALGIKRGDDLTLTASGAGAVAAVQSLKRTILELQLHAHSEPSQQPRSAASATQLPQRTVTTRDGKLPGVIASRGFAVGRVVALRQSRIEVDEAGRGIAVESAQFDRARAELRQQLEGLAAQSSSMAAELLTAHLEFLDDPELITQAKRAISEGKSAGFAWRQAIRRSAEQLRALDDQRMGERINDLLDLETQLLQHLVGQRARQMSLPERAIIIADDLKPSELVSLDAARLAGIALARGGPTSHVALLAAAMGVPALVALGEAVLKIDEGSWVIVDAEDGVLAAAPDAAELASAERTLKAREQRRQSERAAAELDCYTADRTRVEVFANLASVGEAKLAVGNGAEGCGLLRTEFLFLDRTSPPDETEQLRQYQDIAAVLAGRPLIVRTLDIGGDKPIPYLSMPAEENPALGLRGIRTSLWRPDLLRVQLRAILRVQPAGQCRILLPMITDVGEIAAVRGMVEEVQQELGFTAAIQVGAMIETPASALLADRILREVDFVSIGSNDLTQYTLAMDRTHSELAHRIDGLHPAVLSLIGNVAAAGDKQKKLVAVCGGLASEPTAVPILVGLGVRELSVVPTLVPQVKGIVRALQLDACWRLAQRALEQQTAEEVRAIANEFARTQAKVAS